MSTPANSCDHRLFRPGRIFSSPSFLHSLLQNVIDFVSFAIPWLHCRRYCLIRLPDYSSSEWKENGARAMTMQRSQRNAAELNFFRNISHRCAILLEGRHQQRERLLTCAPASVCFCCRRTSATETQNSCSRTSLTSTAHTRCKHIIDIDIYRYIHNTEYEERYFHDNEFKTCWGSSFVKCFSLSFSPLSLLWLISILWERSILFLPRFTSSVYFIKILF